MLWSMQRSFQDIAVRDGLGSFGDTLQLANVGTHTFGGLARCVSHIIFLIDNRDHQCLCQP